MFVSQRIVLSVQEAQKKRKEEEMALFQVKVRFIVGGFVLSFLKCHI